MCLEVDCEVSAWGEYCQCSKKCGGGTMYAKRYIRYNAKNGGEKCPALKKEKSCNMHPCGKFSKVLFKILF